MRAKNCRRTNKAEKQSANRGALKEEDHSEIGKRMQVSVHKHVLKSVTYIKQKNV